MSGSVREKPGWMSTDSDDNSESTATKAAPASKGTHFITSIAGSYSDVTSGKALTLKSGSTTYGIYYVYDTFAIVFPSPVELKAGEAANCTLAASGTGGVTGSVVMTGYTL